MPLETDILVLGAGVAGHCAAISAAERGLKVCLIEKTAAHGGSSLHAAGYVFAGTEDQAQAGVEDNADDFAEDMRAEYDGRATPPLLDLLTRRQLETYDFLRRNGVRFTLLPKANGIARGHISANGKSVDVLHRAALNIPGLQYRSGYSAIRLITENGRVAGAELSRADQIVRIHAAQGVVLATGGFSRSLELLGRFAPRLVDAAKHGGLGNEGDGLKMALALGAALSDTDHITGSLGGLTRNYRDDDRAEEHAAFPPLLFAFGFGAIAVDRTGNRFADESLGYKVLGDRVLDLPGRVAFQIFDDHAFTSTGTGGATTNMLEALRQGYLYRADTIAELANLIAVDADSLTSTITAYNEDARRGTDSRFGRRNSLPIDQPPFYGAPTRNLVTATYGGLAVDESMRVLDQLGQPIAGLFAAGEVVGGFHGPVYVSGTAMTKAALSGLVAGTFCGT